MSNQITRVLLLGGESQDAENLERLLSDEERNFGGVRWQVERQAEASGDLDLDQFVLAFWMMKSATNVERDAFAQLSEIASSVPVIVLLEDSDEAHGYQAVEAGAQDFLLPDEQNPRQLQKAIRSAIARRFALGREAAALLRNQQAREPQEVSAIYGASDLKTTKRNLGITALRDRHPEHYDQLRNIYTDFLNRALDFSNESVVDELNSFADRLGMLGAGPRDIVDLHKEAVVVGQGRHSPARAKSFVEEGRFVMCQLLGFLASYYRTLSWGGVSVRRAPYKANSTRTNPSATKRNTAK